MPPIMGYCRKPGQTALRYAGAMHPFSELADLPCRLHQPALRDLAWTLTSPPLLLNAGIAQRHPLAGSHWADNPERLAAWLTHLDQQPEPLQHWLHSSHNQRLGHYYERLWQFALQQAPGVRLLAANLPVRQGQLTLGELDLLLEDRDGVHHLELAVKFYLGCPPLTEQWQRWIGPGREDRLDRKLNHLRQHQLQLAQSHAARQLLRSLATDTVNAAAWLGGYLFRPWQIPVADPVGANPQGLSGDWLHRAQLDDYVQQNADCRWVLLERLQWLAPADRSNQSCHPISDLPAWWDTLPQQPPRPQLIALLESTHDGHWQEVRRSFICADDWASAAALGTPAGTGQIT